MAKTTKTKAKTKQHGGPRPGSGRPPVADPKRAVTVTLTAAQIDHLRTLGDGNVSEGVRRLIEKGTTIHDTTA